MTAQERPEDSHVDRRTSRIVMGVALAALVVGVIIYFLLRPA